MVLAAFPEVEEALIFGSRAAGTHKPGSDIDLVLKGLNLDRKILAKFEATLDDLPLPYKVDVLHYETLENVKLRKHIDEAGQLFYSLGAV
jgi:predicted nucleotidyltransferase